jgi:hypothetical protein
MAKPKGSPLSPSDEPLYAAATGTIAALKPGMSDPIIALVLRELEALKQSFVRARSGQLQIADTPIGQEMAANDKASEIDKRDARAARKTTGEHVDGQPEGVNWAEHTPTPRPKLGDRVYTPHSKEGAPITKINGFDESTQSFLVCTSGGDISYAVYKADTIERAWRVRGETYNDAQPSSSDVDTSGQQAADGTGAADELLSATKDSTQLLDVGEVLDESGIEGDGAATTDVVEHDTDAAGEPRDVAPQGKRAAKKAGGSALKSGAQRARNEATNGLRKGAKPTAAKKGGRGK